MKKIIFLSLCFILANIVIFADATNDQLNVKKFLSQEEINKVLKGDIISRMFIKYNAKGENTHMGFDVPTTKYVPEDVSMYEVLADEKAFIPFQMTNESKLKLFNIMASFSKLKGMEYYSRSSGKIEELIINCFKITSEKNTKEEKDPVYNEILPKVTNYFLQQDNKFGKLIWKSEIFNEGDNFAQVNTCVQPIKAIIDVNNAGEYKIISYLIYDKDKKGFYFYSINALRVRNDTILKTGVLRPTTFSNRLRAGTIKLVKSIGLDWSSKFNPWDEQKLKNGEYKTF